MEKLVIRNEELGISNVPSVQNNSSLLTPNSSFKKGFTLAEVLITLGVIGIVAALTMPALIANYQKKQTVTQLQKAYSVLNQAAKLAAVDHDDFEFTGATLADTTAFMEKYILPYMKTVKTCIPVTECITISDYSQLNGAAITTLMGTQSNLVGATLADGTMIIVGAMASNDNYRFTVDLNGKKGPNVIGKDLFRLDIYNLKDGVVFSGGGWSREGLLSGVSPEGVVNTSNACALPDGDGRTCGALIQLDGWEIKDDYPW